MSERVFNWKGKEYNCSHLFRDRIFLNNSQKVKQCKYGCNRRLVKFNQELEKELRKEVI